MATGAELAYKFRLAIEAVAPGFTDTEISEFLTQGQIALVKEALGTPFLMPISRLHRMQVFDNGAFLSREMTNFLYRDSYVFRGELSESVLKLEDVLTAIITMDNNDIYYSTQVVDPSNISKFLTTATNKPYLERPVSTVTSLLNNDDNRELLVIYGANHPVSQISNVAAIVEYVTYPKPIDATDDVNPIEFPEFADDIVNVATSLALKSLYNIQGLTQQEQQGKQE